VLEPRTASSILYQDLMEIDKLNNAELLYHLRVNFESKNIYTYVGNNLLVVNPYKWYP
jgi:myosin heavy subunit